MGVKVLKLLSCLLIAGSLGVVPTLSATPDGYAMGGGLDALSCPEFLHRMQQLRDNDGFEVNADGAVWAVRYHEYLAGFRHAFNMMTPGVFDIFAPLGDDEYNKALFAMEAYCRDKPTKGLADALYDLLVELQLEAKVSD